MLNSIAPKEILVHRSYHITAVTDPSNTYEHAIKALAFEALSDCMLD